MPPALLTNLVRALADDWPSVRRDAAYALGVVMTPPIDDRVADELIYSLADPDGSVRLAAVKALGRLRVTRAGDQLIGRIVDPDLPVRLAAMHAVGEIREARALVALQQQLDYYRGATAGRAALAALARIAHRSTMNLFAQERFSKSEAHRRYAYEGIARLGGIAAADAVAMEQLLIEERDEAVRRGHGVRPGCFWQAVRGTRGHGPRRSRYGQSGDRVRRRARRRAAVGARALPEAHRRDRARASRYGDGFVADADAEAALSQLTSDGDPSVRRAAESAIIRMRATKQAATLRPTP